MGCERENCPALVKAYSACTDSANTPGSTTPGYLRGVNTNVSGSFPFGSLDTIVQWTALCALGVIWVEGIFGKGRMP